MFMFVCASICSQEGLDALNGITRGLFVFRSESSFIRPYVIPNLNHIIFPWNVK